MSIDQQIERFNTNLERLNANLEALVGVVAANTSVASGITNAIAGAVAPQAAENPLGDGGEDKNPRGAGRPKTLYYRLANGEVVKSSSKEAPVEGAVEITKAEYDEAQKPKAPAKAADPKPAAEPAAPADGPTLDDVREVALKYRDKTDQATAKAHIATFGVASIKDLPPEKFAEFIAKTNALINGGDDL